MFYGIYSVIKGYWDLWDLGGECLTEVVKIGRVASKEGERLRV